MSYHKEVKYIIIKKTTDCKATDVILVCFQKWGIMPKPYAWGKTKIIEMLQEQGNTW